MAAPLTRREFAKIGATLTSAAFLAPFSGAVPVGRTNSRGPNVLLVLTDDQGYGDLSCHGNEQLRTPNIDSFAATGVEMTEFYVCPVCAPSRSSLLTGQYNYRTGVQHTSRGGALMATEKVTIAEMFHAGGYATGIFGKWHLGDDYPLRPMDQGFEESLVFKGGGIGSVPDLPNSYFDTRLYENGKPVEGEGYCTEVFTDATIRFIETNRKRPFFAYLPYNAPHGPLVVDKKYSEPFRAMGLDEKVADLYGMVVNLDQNFGRILNRLRELDLEQNTIVIFMSDNGAWSGARRYNAGLAGWKGSVQDGGIRAPFFFRWPAAGLQGGRKVDRIAAHIDVLPTLLDATGVSKTDGIEFDGVSLMPLFRDGNANWPDRNLYFQFHRGLVPQRYQNCAVRNQRWKASSRAGDEVQHDTKDLPLQPAFKLYDMEKDPGETTDLASQNPEIVQKMKASYDEWYEKMEHSRDWAVGVIHIGSKNEPVTHLSVYQDNCYNFNQPTGWSVEIERGGHYRVTINRPNYPPANLVVKFNNKITNLPLEQGENSKIVKLPAGQGMLDIWVEPKKVSSAEVGQRPVVALAGNWEVTATSTAGDCDIEFLRE